MRRAARIVENMMATIFEHFGPGVRKNELVAEIYRSGILGADGHGGDYPAIVPMLPTGLDASAPHLTWDDKPLQRGAGTFFEIAGVYRRYHCPLSRTAYIGQPPDDMLRARDAVMEGLGAGLGAAKPGYTCEYLAMAFYDALARHGVVKSSRTGYPIGLSYPPDWGERTMSLRPGDTTVLEPGMTFHFMPGLWADEWGLEMSESILITETGVECFASVLRDIYVVS
jgi:ectoine hydrolase